MNVRFRISAVEEADQAADYLDKRQAGLGAEFLEAVQRAIDQIEKQPGHFPKLETLHTNHDVRRVRIDNFSSTVVYNTSRSTPEIIAVMHTHRDPEYLRSRIE